MLGLIGCQNICESIVALSSVTDRPDFKDFKEVENAFHLFLGKQQPDVPRSKILGTTIIEDKDLEQKLANLFYTDSYLDDMNQSSLVKQSYDTTDFIEAKQKINEAIEFLKEEYEEAYFALQFVIDSVLIRHSDVSGGGSTSNAIGVIWVNNRKHWSKNDLVELLIHELTHNLVFIDELRYEHYADYDLLLDEDNYSLSAILSKKRPLDKVVHSIIVATEVVMLRKHYLGEPTNPCVHPPSNKVIEQTLSACDSLFSMPNYFQLTTERTRFLLDECAYTLRNIDEEVLA